MDQIQIINQVELRGTVADKPQYSHESRGEEFFQFPLQVERLSGAQDILNVVLRKTLMEKLEIGGGGKLHVVGELRSFNNKSGQGSKLVITVFARELEFDDGEDLNLVKLTGSLCKSPNLRTTPMGRDICDLLLAVNRKYGRSDYLPCIAWGLTAKEGANWNIGDRVSIQGRVQSRQYIKNIDGVPMEKTAFEVSVTDAQLAQQD